MALMANLANWGSISSSPLLWIIRNSPAIVINSVGVVSSISIDEVDGVFKKSRKETLESGISAANGVPTSVKKSFNLQEMSYLSLVSTLSIRKLSATWEVPSSL